MVGRTDYAGAEKLKQALAGSQQRAEQSQQESVQQLSNIMKKWHDTMKQIMNNLRG